MRFHPQLPIAFVAMASPEDAEAFRLKARSPHPFLCDHDKELYASFGLREATGKQVFGPRVFARGFGATLRGHWVGKPIGDPWQMPGVFLIERDGQVSWEYRSGDAADNISAATVSEQLGCPECA